MYAEKHVEKKIDWIPWLGILAAVVALLFGNPGTGGLFAGENGFTLEHYQNADAKFMSKGTADGSAYEPWIITSVKEELCALDFSGKTAETFPGLNASWLYTAPMPEGGAAVAYSNHDNETHILCCPDISAGSWNDQLVGKTDTLAIDPILVQVDSGWLLSHTLIDGTINNPDPDGDNGTYTVKLYRTDSLSSGTWEFVTDVITHRQNLEDGDMVYPGDGCLYYFFEMEQYDKGPSQVCVMISEDEGQTWSEPKELLPAVADNEMAVCERTETGWRLYYSSDKACVGESYQGASAYYADYDFDFRPLKTYQLLDMKDNKSVRLYDVAFWDGKYYFLFNRNFLTDCDLLLRAGRIE